MICRNSWGSHLCPQHLPQVMAHERIHSKCERSKEEMRVSGLRLSSLIAHELHWDEVWGIFMPRPHLQVGASLWVTVVVCQLLLSTELPRTSPGRPWRVYCWVSALLLSPASRGALTLTLHTREEGRAPITQRGEEKQGDLNVCFERYLLSDNLSHCLPTVHWLTESSGLEPWTGQKYVISC